MSILDNIKGDGELQREKRIAVKRNALEGTVDEIVRRYDDWLIRGDTIRYDDQTLKVSQRLDGICINHRIIDEFCLRLQDYQGEVGFRNSGFFLTAMVQNAYDQGHNDFSINLRYLERSMGFIGCNISGKEDHNIRLTFNGDAEYSFGKWAKHSQFILNGAVGIDCGYLARHSDFTLMGGVGNYCGIGAVNSTFYSPDKKVLRRIKREAESSCDFYLLNPDGASRPYGLRTKVRDFIARRSR